MQKRLKGSYRDIAYIELFENMYMRNTLNVNLCCKEDASPFFHFGEHFSRFWLFLQGAGVCWDSESHYSPLENEFPFQRDVGKDGKMKVTARCEGGNERWNQGILGSKATGFVKNVLAERPSGRSQVSHPVCQDITVNRQRDSNSDLPAVSDFGLLGSICSSSCLSVVVACCWGLVFSIAACLVHRRVQGPVSVWPRHSSVRLLQVLTYFVVIATIIHR